MHDRKRRSSLCFLISLLAEIFLLCFVIAFIGYYAERKYSSTVQNPAVAVSEKLTYEECVTVCDTKECVQHSKLLLENVQETVEPCEDFNRFACGGFMEKMDPEKTSSFIFQHTSVTRNKIKNFLDNFEASPESSSGKMKTVYNSCLEYGSSEKEAIPSLLQMLNSFGIHGWPHLAPDYKFKESSFAGVVSNFLLYKEYGFVLFSVESMKREDPNPKINLTICSDESPYGNKDPEVRQHELTRILKYFNIVPETIDEIWKDSEAILSAIQSLGVENERIHSENENSTSPREGHMECIEDATGEWAELCKSMESYINLLELGEKVNKNYANIPDSDLYFVENVFRVLGNFSDRSIANYLVLNVFMNHLKDLSFYFRLLNYDPKNFNTLKENAPIMRWENCVNWIISHMTFALAHEYVKDDFITSVLQEVDELTEELIHETKETVFHQDWIPADILENIIMKIENIDHHDQNYILLVSANVTFVNQFYEEFEPSERSFLLNVFEYGRFTVVHKMRGLSAIDFTNFLMPLFMTGATGGDGELMINPGILQPPMYTPHLERLINVITLGEIIVHEIGHNVQSFLMHEYMRLNTSYDDYIEKTQCLNKQFSEFRVESLGKNLDGSKLSVENEADNMAVSIIDKLIKKYIASGGEISLPGLPYSTEQLLYISAAQNWCSVYTKETSKLSFEIGSHSPFNFRLIGMMQNSRGFSEAFSCPEGSYMNPSIKCNFLTEKEGD